MARELLDKYHPKVQEWTKGNKIVGSVWNQHSDYLWVIVQEFTRAGKETKDYALLRFFHLGENVEVSVDITARPINDFLEAFLLV